jgi:predicted MFS family arabinose efflux permease
MKTRERSLPVVIAALGIGQIISWGTLTYSIAVLGRSMRAELGLTETELFGAFTISLFASGLAAPLAGRLIDSRGAREVLSVGSMLGAISMIMMAFATGRITFTLAWIVAGIAMAATLYDAGFAALNQIARDSYRRSVTILTLWGGFASTVFWPLSLAIDESFGWRITLGSFALLHLLVCLPIHRFLLPPPSPVAKAQDTASAVAATAHVLPRGQVFLMLAIAFALSQLVVSAIAAHVIEILRSASLSAAEAVLVGSLIGPMQVAGRIVEFGFGQRVTATLVGVIAFILMLSALLMLAAVSGPTLLAFAFAVIYGMSNGIMTIVRGTVPAELFGREGYGAILGRLAQPVFFAKAVAPLAFAAVMASGVGRTGAVMTLAACGGLGLIAFVAAVASVKRQRSAR